MKHLLIIGCTHGNEVVGADLHEYLLQHRDTFASFGGISITSVLANSRAYSLFCEQRQPQAYRFIDHDFNRIWDDSWVPNSYEYARREEMKPLLLSADIIFDIHSVSKGDDVLGIADENSLFHAQKWMDTEYILLQKRSASSLTAWCSRQGKIAYGIEAGNHSSSLALERVLRNLHSLCAYHSFPYVSTIKPGEEKEVLEFFQEITVRDESFHFSQDFIGFTAIHPGEIYAYEYGLPLRNTLPYILILGIVAKYPEIGKSGGFLFRKGSNPS